MFCDARPRRHVIHNNVEKVTYAEVQIQCLQAERANTKSNAVNKKRELQLKFTRYKNDVGRF